MPLVGCDLDGPTSSKATFDPGPALVSERPTLGRHSPDDETTDEPKHSEATRDEAARDEAAQGSAPDQPGEPTVVRGPKPLWTDDWLVELEIEGFLPTLVAVPRGATERRPIVVALHGYGDRADWQCGAWTGISEARAFIVCPRGIELPKTIGNYTYGTVRQTEREVEAALAAVRERFARYVSPAPATLVGFSLGAMRAAHLASRNPKLFPRVALVEGGTKEWNALARRRFVEGGGERLLMVCSQAGCRHLVAHLARASEAKDTLAKSVYLGNLGHHMGPKVTSKLKQPWAWLTHGLFDDEPAN